MIWDYKSVTRTALKKNRYVESKQHAAQQSMYYWRNKRVNQKVLYDKWKWRHNNPKFMGHNKHSSKREVCSNTDLPQEIGKVSNKQHNFLWKGTRKRIKSRVSRRKKIIKISVKTSGIETKKRKKQ